MTENSTPPKELQKKGKREGIEEKEGIETLSAAAITNKGKKKEYREQLMFGLNLRLGQTAQT